MNILFINTTNHNDLYVGIAQDTTILLDYLEELHKGIVENIDDLTKTLLKDAKLDLKNINLIVVAQGPGSHTGIRIGMAFAKALSQICSIPIVGIQSDGIKSQDLVDKGFQKYKKFGGDDFIKLLPIYKYN